MTFLRGLLGLVDKRRAVGLVHGRSGTRHTVQPYTVQPLHSAAAIQCGPLYSALATQCSRYTEQGAYTVERHSTQGGAPIHSEPTHTERGHAHTLSQHRRLLWLYFKEIEKSGPIHGALYAEPTRTTVEIRNSRQPTPRA